MVLVPSIPSPRPSEEGNHSRHRQKQHRTEHRTDAPTRQCADLCVLHVPITRMHDGPDARPKMIPGSGSKVFRFTFDATLQMTHPTMPPLSVPTTATSMAPRSDPSDNRP